MLQLLHGSSGDCYDEPHVALRRLCTRMQSGWAVGGEVSIYILQKLNWLLQKRFNECTLLLKKFLIDKFECSLSMF